MRLLCISAMILSFGCGSVYQKDRADQVPLAEYLTLLDSLPDAQLIDIRTPMEYRRAHMPGAQNINYLSFSFQRQIEQLDPTRPTFIYCHTAHRSPFVAHEMLEAGFERVIDLEGGFRTYSRWMAQQDSASATEELYYPSENLEIRQLAPGVYQHISYLRTESFGNVPCNGLVVVDRGEALVVDTPTDDVASTELIGWLEREHQARIVGVIPTHFHEDCLGGLHVFHERDMPSFAHEGTLSLARATGKTVPQSGFEDSLTLRAGGLELVAFYPGPGHTQDNIVAFIPSQDLLFGGCLVKSAGAGKGNLEDADTSAWPGTVARVSKRFPDARIIVPGHGDPAGRELLAYTRKLFQP